METNYLKGLSKTGGTLADRWAQQLSGATGKKGSEKAKSTYK
jgi:hypothetical protein